MAVQKLRSAGSSQLNYESTNAAQYGRDQDYKVHAIETQTAAIHHLIPHRFLSSTSKTQSHPTHSPCLFWKKCVARNPDLVAFLW